MSKTQQKFEEFRRKLRRLGFNSYGAYLQSSHWRKYRDRYVASGLPLCCTACGSSKYQLHHVTYDCLGDERLSDVIPLCRECHERVHEHAKLHHMPLERTDLILKRIFAWSDAEMKRRFDPFVKQEAIETGMPPFTVTTKIERAPDVFQKGRYVVPRQGPAQPYATKRIRNEARRTACRMAHDGFMEKFHAVQPTDPMLMAECQRILVELARRGRVGGTT
jgi:5-methylcytosine-specific restriction endonuclease McrA